jgi:hypothetical protein
LLLNCSLRSKKKGSGNEFYYVCPTRRYFKHKHTLCHPSCINEQENAKTRTVVHR